MKKYETPEELVESGLIVARKQHVLDITLSNGDFTEGSLTWDQFERLSESERSQIDVRKNPIVVDDAIFTFTTNKPLKTESGLKLTSSSRTYSWNGSTLVECVGDRKVLKRKLGSHGFNIVGQIPLKGKPNTDSEESKKGENKMAENNTPPIDEKELEDIIGGTFGDTQDNTDSSPSQMNAFDQNANNNTQDDTPNTGTRKTLELSEEVTRAARGEQLTSAAELYSNSQKYGFLPAYIVTNDARIVASTQVEKVKDPQTGKILLQPNRSKEVVAAHEKSPSKTKIEHIVTRNVLNLKQVAPSPIVGMVIAIPENSLVPMSELKRTDKGDIKPLQDASTNVVYRMMSKDDGLSFISLYFDGHIKESPETHGAAANWIDIVAAPVTQEVETGAGKVTKEVLKPKLKSSRGVNPILPGNYFPIHTYVTSTFSSKLTPDELSELNMSLFGNLFQPKYNKEGGIKEDPKYANLVAEERNLISLEKEGDKEIYKSKYFTHNSDELIVPSITPFNVKKGTKTLSTFEIPLKEWTQPSDPTKRARLVYKRVSTLSDKERDAQYESLKSLNNPKFSNVVKACGGILTVENLSQLVSKGTNNKTSKRVLSGSSYTNILRQSIRGEDVGMETTLSSTPVNTLMQRFGKVLDKEERVKVLV